MRLHRGFHLLLRHGRRAYPSPPEESNLRLASFYGIVYVLGIIPLWHRLNRIAPAKVTEWATALKTYGYSDPGRLAGTIAWLIDGTCLLGFGGAGIWLWIHFRRLDRWAALPVLWLSATMLLFQNLAALYLLYPARAHYINMHHVFWIMMLLMVAYVAFVRPRPVTMPDADGATPEPGVPWARWIAGAIVGLALIIFLAGYVNNDQTMKTATTRWPVWSWRNGPFPGRGARHVVHDNEPERAPQHVLGPSYPLPLIASSPSSSSATLGRASCLMTLPSRRNTRLGQSLTRNDRPSGRPGPSSTQMKRTSG